MTQSCHRGDYSAEHFQSIQMVANFIPENGVDSDVTLCAPSLGWNKIYSLKISAETMKELRNAKDFLCILIRDSHLPYSHSCSVMQF